MQYPALNMKCIRMQTKSLLYRYVLVGYMLCLWHVAARLDLSLQICRGHAVALPSFAWVLLYICLIALLRIGLLCTSDTAPLHYCIIAWYAIVCGAFCCRVLCNCGLEIGSDIRSKYCMASLGTLMRPTTSGSCQLVHWPFQ